MDALGENESNGPTNHNRRSKGRILSESNWKKNLLTENPLLPASVPIFSLKFPANVCEMIYSGDRVMLESSMSSYVEKGKTKTKRGHRVLDAAAEQDQVCLRPDSASIIIHTFARNHEDIGRHAGQKGGR